MTAAADVFGLTEALDRRVQVAVETIRALRAAGVDDPLGPYRADLEARLSGGEIDEREAQALLSLAEALTALAAEAEAAAVLQ